MQPISQRQESDQYSVKQSFGLVLHCLKMSLLEHLPITVVEFEDSELILGKSWESCIVKKQFLL
jgi:hypothetical protein